MFTTSIESDNGFHIRFSNGWIASVQWGYGTYSDNRKRKTAAHSKTAEIAAWDKDGTWYNFGDDTVKGWQSPEEVARFLDMVSKF